MLGCHSSSSFDSIDRRVTLVRKDREAEIGDDTHTFAIKNARVSYIEEDQVARARHS